MNLAKLRDRPPEDPTVQYEFRSLQAERLVEREAAKERYGIDHVNFKVSLLEYKRLFTSKPLLHRLMIGASAQALQQWTGINVSRAAKRQAPRLTLTIRLLSTSACCGLAHSSRV